MRGRDGRNGRIGRIGVAGASKSTISTERPQPAAAIIRACAALAVALAACAPPHPNPNTLPAPNASTAPIYERQVAPPFTVLDEHGRPYEHAFLGGLDVPRPHFLDIDADGDLDLFVQERSNELMFFENTATGAAGGYVWRTDKYHGLDVAEWTRFVDIDGDGDYDLLAEQPFSYIRLYRNEGTKQRAVFRLAADSLRDHQGGAIFADRQNILNVVDIDCNGLLDLFLGRVEGTIAHYEEVQGSGTQFGVPRFRFVTERWENIEIIGQQIGSMHGANTMYFADPDQDGDLDLFWGDFFEDGVLLIPNTGSCAVPSLRNEPAVIRLGESKLSTSGYNVPVLVDIDQDRDLDLLVGVLGGAFNPNKTSSNNFYFLLRQPNGFELKTQRYLRTIDVGSESSAAAGDLDGDGDLDLLLGNKLDPGKLNHARLYLLRNTGTARQPALQLADTIDLPAATYHFMPALADLDADGDLDLVLGTWNQGVQFYRNQGTRSAARWVQDSAATLTLTRGSNATPALTDIDADGDLDLFVGEASGEINFFRNIGSKQQFRYELVSDVFQGLDTGRRSHPAFIDWDGDGDLDMFAGMEAGGLAYFRNDGTRQEPKFVADSTVLFPLPHMGAPLFADFDGDGDLDVLSGGLSGGLWYFTRQ
ncbi:MAG: FG-GAP repeat domain-containing protein [Longimicrobiales bacterium]